jgi:tripartite-type tricarboxylate transporter receptor subunit TctC
MRLLVLIAASIFPVLGWAQAFPSKPVRVVVPYPAGGVVDVLTRVITARMSTDLGQAVVVESRPGANANLGAEAVARSAPDGYTLLVSAPFFINNPMLEKDLRWQPKDFTPVARYILSPSFVVVPTSLPVGSVKEYVDHARAKPGLPVGDAGGGTTQTMATEMLAAAAKINISLIGYKGAPPIVPDLANGNLTMAVLPITVAVSASKTGKVKVLANTSARRSPIFPDVPTIAEAGFPDVTVLSWYAFHAPAGTPREALARLEQAVDAATRDPEVQQRAANAGGEVAFLGARDFAQFLDEDARRWRQFADTIKKK